MNGNRLNVVFSGDLTDPWVQALRSAIPTPTRVLEDLEFPGEWPGGHRPTVLILHRGVLTVAERDRLRRLRETMPALRVILIVGPHARYQQIMEWSGLLDTILPEATAFEAIARQVCAEPGARNVPDRPIPVVVVSGHWELGRMIEDILLEAGYAPRLDRDGLLKGAEPWAVWDVPVFDPNWPDLLKDATQRRGVIALLGLADRELVTTALARGALACLDLPSDPETLVSVLDRFSNQNTPSRRRRDSGHVHRSRTVTGRSQVGPR